MAAQYIRDVTYLGKLLSMVGIICAVGFLGDFWRSFEDFCLSGELNFIYAASEEIEVGKKKMIPQDVKSTGSVGKLLSTPTNVNQTESVYSRVNCSFENLSERFGHHSKDFAKQFAHIYAVRLTKMRELLTKRIRNKWGNVYISYIEVVYDVSFHLTKICG
jgi:hypothetical protein